MRIGVNTTLKTNPGDDFIREGAIYLMDKVFPGAEYVLGQKHTNDQWTRPQVEEQIARVLSCDVLLQAGAPVFCDGISMGERAHMEWVDLFWRKAPPRSVYALASGAAFLLDWHWRKQSAADDECNRMMLNRSRIMTVRDSFAYDMLRALYPEYNVPLLPCTSLWAAKRLGIQAKPEYGVLNYMHNTGWHEYKNSHWETVALAFYKTARKAYGRCVAICHRADEIKLARALGVEAKDILYFEHDYAALLTAYSKGITGLVNRIHGACALLSFGLPAACVCNDTRVNTVTAAGGRAIKSPDMLALKGDQLFRDLDRSRAQVAANIEQLRTTSEQQYIQLIRNSTGAK